MSIPFVLFGLVLLTDAFDTESSITLEQLPAEMDGTGEHSSVEKRIMNHHALAGARRETSNNTYKANGIQTKRPTAKENEIESSFNNITESDGNQTNTLTYAEDRIETNNLDHGRSEMASLDKASKGYGMETNRLEFAKERTANFNPIDQASEMETSEHKVTGNEADGQIFSEDEKKTYNSALKVNVMDAKADKLKERDGNEKNPLPIAEGLEIVTGDTTNATLAEGKGGRLLSHPESVNHTNSEVATMKLIGPDDTDNMTDDLQTRRNTKRVASLLQCGYYRWCGDAKVSSRFKTTGRGRHLYLNRNS